MEDQQLRVQRLSEHSMELKTRTEQKKVRRRAVEMVQERAPDQDRFWSEADTVLCTQWLEHSGDSPKRQLAFAAIDLKLVAPKQLPEGWCDAAVAEMVRGLTRDLRSWERLPDFKQADQAQRIVDEWVIKIKLLSPEEPLHIPKKFWDVFKESLESAQYRNILRCYRILFPDDWDQAKQERLWTFYYKALQEDKKRKWENWEHDLLAGLATLRLIDEERFLAMGVSGEERVAIQKLLMRERKEAQLEFHSLVLPGELFLALIVDAQHVRLSKERGVELEFPPSALQRRPTLPERLQLENTD